MWPKETRSRGAEGITTFQIFRIHLATTTAATAKIIIKYTNEFKKVEKI